MDITAFGSFVRSRRGALQPEDVGLRHGSRRRTPGLRREELAELADMSADYLARLERGAGPRPSEQMISALARALRLSIDERDHLLVLAGHQAPARTGADGHVSPGLMRILDRLADTPALVLGPIGQTLAQNTAAIALLGDASGFRGPRRSAIYRWFTDPGSRAIYPKQDHEHHSRVQVSQLRTVAARLGPDSDPARLAHHLEQLSPEFARLWSSQLVGVRQSEQKRIAHPEVGELVLHCQVASDLDQTQSLLVFTATPGTPSAQRLRLLTVVATLS